MRNSTADRRLISDVEITLTEGEIVESRLATLKPTQLIPNEVYASGPDALNAYQAFLKRVASGVDSHIVEHIEMSTAA